MRRASVAGALVLVGALTAACASATVGAGPDPTTSTSTTTTTTTTVGLAPSQPTPPSRPAHCRSGTVSVVLQPDVAPPPVCLRTGATLLVSLHAEPDPGDDVWSGRPSAADPSVLQTTSTAPVGGLVTTHLLAVAAGQTTVVGQSNAACDVNPAVSPPCSQPVHTSTLAVWVVSP